MAGRGVFCFFSRRDEAGFFFPRRDGAFFFFFPRRDGAVLVFFRGGTGWLFFFFSTGRDGAVFFFFIEGRNGTVAFGGGNYFGGTGQNRYTVPPKAVQTVPPAVHVKPWIFFPRVGCSEGLDAFRFFFKIPLYIMICSVEHKHVIIL